METPITEYAYVTRERTYYVIDRTTGTAVPERHGGLARPRVVIGAIRLGDTLTLNADTIVDPVTGRYVERPAGTCLQVAS